MGMTPQQEKAFEAKAEKMLAGHRQPPNGRNAFAFVMRYLNNECYRGKFDSTFSGSPSSEKWLDEKFCSKCDKRRVYCTCKKN